MNSLTLQRLVVVVPTRNEEKNIRTLLKRIPKDLATDTKIVVIDKSLDRTAMIAKEEGALVLPQSNGGLGTAFRQGIEEGLRLDADALAHIDADMQYDPNQMRLLLQPIIEGKADMVLGQRIVQYRMPRINRVGNKLFSLLVSALSGVKISDAQTGYRVLSRRAMKTLLAIRGDHTYTQESILVASKRGLRIKEVPITFRKRDHGRSFINLVRYPILVLVILITAYVREL